MARKTNVGLRYFPLDVDFHDDSKIELITAEFGPKGESILMRLLCRIYKNGYFLKYTDDIGLLIATRVGCSGSLVGEVVKGSVRRSFFDEGIFNQFNILTSKGIQERYLEACGRRQKVTMLQELLLVQQDVYIEHKNVNIVSLNVNISTQTKVNNTKVEESKVNETQGEDFSKKADEVNAEEKKPPNLPPPPPRKYFGIPIRYKDLF